jgi:imidazolonepropionase-like amidohydrolase
LCSGFPQLEEFQSGSVAIVGLGNDGDYRVRITNGEKPREMCGKSVYDARGKGCLGERAAVVRRSTMMRRSIGRRRVAFIAAFVLLAATAQAQDVVAFRGVRVFDGEKVVGPTTVVVVGGVIRQVGSDAEVPEGSKFVDGAGKTLLPGLFDCHTHTFNAGQLRQAAVFGVTTELDMFTDATFAATMRSEQREGRATDRADLLSAGTLVTAPGGHGTEYGLKIPTITAPEQAEAFVGARLAEGSDYIKIIYDDGKLFGLAWRSIDRPTLAAVIRAAHARKRLAVVHVSAREFAREALAEGADGLVHVFTDRPIDANLVELAAGKKAFVVPTLTVLEGISGVGSGSALLDDPDLAPWISTTDARALKAAIRRRGDATETRAVVKEAVHRLHQAGVPILAGTDTSNPGTAHGLSVHRELELLVASGLSPVEALKAATATPAKLFGLDDRGRVAPGLRADLVLVAGDPTATIKDTRKILGVWKQGRPIDRAAYRAEVEKQAEAASRARTMPPPKGSERGLVSDFEGEKIAVEFGSGWTVSTDAIVGGKSKAEIKLVPGGANSSKGALKITGMIEDRPQPRWAGAFFSPGPAPMAPANLSSKKVITLRAKGDGKSYQVMLFSSASGRAPARRSFTVGGEWEEYRFKLAEFDGADGSGLMGVFFGGGDVTGPFELLIDDVRFE